MADEELSPNQILAQISQSLKESRSTTDKQLDDLGRKLELVMPKIEQLQRDVLVIQADMRTMFVLRAEYEPRHKALEDRMQTYDKIISDSRVFAERFFAVETKVGAQEKINNSITEEIADLDGRMRGAIGKSAPWIAIIISALALVSQVLGHIQIR